MNVSLRIIIENFSIQGRMIDLSCKNPKTFGQLGLKMPLKKKKRSCYLLSFAPIKLKNRNIKLHLD